MKTRPLIAFAFALNLAALDQVTAGVTITRHPADQRVSLGAYVTNQVTATTTAPPLTYQWYGKGLPLPDQTNRTCTLADVQLDQAGEYHVVVNDAENVPVPSESITLGVDPTFIKITRGPLVEDLEPTEGSTWWDPDGDDFLDVCVHVVAPAGPGLPQSFYRNNRDGTFTKDTANAIALAPRRGSLAGVGDYDNDGDQDCYVSGNAHAGSDEPTCDLFRNDGNGIFTALSDQPWTRDIDSTLDASFVDYDRDGLLDIFVVNGQQEIPCLYRQTTAGSFDKLSAAQAGSILVNPPESYNATWADYDNDGDPDLWFENSLGSGRLHQNNGSGSFILATPAALQQSRPGGMGLWMDYDNDGFLDLFVGGYGDDGSYTNALYRNLNGQDFTDVAEQAGVALRMGAWAAAAGDYDNDGWIDIFAADWQGRQPSVLFRNRADGTFESQDVGSPIRDGGDSRAGVRWVDYDNDGFLDLFMTCGTVNLPRPNHLFRNNSRQKGNTNHWLKIKLNGVAANRSGIGAKIRIQTTMGGQQIWQLREMSGNGYSQTCPGLVAHFGLGDATEADLVRIEWPSGIVQSLTQVSADQILSITEHQDYAGPIPAFAGVVPSPGGVELTINEPDTDTVYVLEASADLRAWSKLMVRASGGASHAFTDGLVSSAEARFYRLVVP